MGRYRLLPALTLVIGAVVASPASAAEAQPELTFTEPDELAYALPSEDHKTVWLRSEGAGGDLTWELLVDKGAARQTTVPEADAPGARRRAALEVQGPKGIEADSVAAYRVRIRGLPADGVKGAQLVVTAREAAPASLDVSISEESDFSPTLDAVLIAPLAVALFLLLIRGATLNNGFGGTVGTVNLDFSKSFATTLTAIGALLGTILSAGLLDDATSGISKEGFQALNLTFGVLILVAPLLYLVFQKQVQEDKTIGSGSNIETTKATHYKGKTWALLLASVVTLWAVLGEIVTIYLLLGQLDAIGELSSLAITVMQIALGVGAILAIAYSWRKLRWIVETAEGGTAPDLAGGFVPVEGAARVSGALPPWTPL